MNKDTNNGSTNNLYKTSEMKLIYIQTAKNDNGMLPYYDGKEKIGDASIDTFELNASPNSDDLRRAADKRIRTYMGTAGLPYNLQWAELAYRKLDNSWFRDYDVHRVLERSNVKRADDLGSGHEWFQTDLTTAKKAISAVKLGKEYIDSPSENLEHPKITLRPEQRKAVDQTKKVFKNNYRMLWNAKMRFGKTLSALELVKEEDYKHILIMTHRPIVDEGWFNDFEKIGMSKFGYKYGSKNYGEDFDTLINDDDKFIYFASLQDLRGSKIIGGSSSNKNIELFDTEWDLVIIDEAHEGTQTELAKRVTNKLIEKKHTKVLELSGTPFNLLDNYDEESVFTWDYVMEQSAKKDWSETRPNEDNPYETLPKVSMYTFEMKKNFYSGEFIEPGTKSFNFKEFFKVDNNGKFVYESKVYQFLDNISHPDKRTNYPFSTDVFRDRLRHTLWILPGVKEANALEDLMNRHQVFKDEYNIVNVVRNGDNDGFASDNDLDKVNEAIGDDPATSRTITLTVRKMTTGVTVKPWTGVLFLSNTNSAMQYLQAAFRAQTPYSSETFGQKTNCYIFDFAPDRALTVMAESINLNTGVGKRTTTLQKDKMKELMNFLPIIGEKGNGMKPYKVDTLLAQIKRVYAEKAVRSGFDDDSLYNDELLMLKDVDIKAFNSLKAIVGTTKKEKKPLDVNVNDQGLSDEEYNRGENGRKKPKKDRTPEEQEAIDKMNSLKRQRRTMISILRSISIRIPMMIYGMDIDLNKDVKISTFVENVDNESWNEFMPKGVTKELFIKFSKYYDSDVFIEAGKIIRREVKNLDNCDPLDRIKKVADIFNTFRNPDKETVLTPWRVVNLQLGKTLGGLSFFDNKYENTTIDGKDAIHWVDTDYTNKMFNSDSHILEINSKTGLYPLYATASIYYKEYNKLNSETGGKFTFDDELFIWQKILRENIFVIAKTPMAKSITKRTLTGYRDMESNVEFINNIVNNSKSNLKKEANDIKEKFGIMKFDVVIGNPPYQLQGKGNRYEPVYNQFMDLSYKLADVVTLITPARFLFNAGQTPSSWNEKMLNDIHLKVIMYEKISSNIFPRTDIKGGVAITLRDINKDFGKIGVFTSFKVLDSIIKKVNASNNFESLSNIVSSRGTYRFTETFFNDFPDAKNILGKGSSDMIVSNIFKKIPNAFVDNPNSVSDYFEILGRFKNKRVFKYISKKYVKNNEYIEKYKVMLPEANGSGRLGEALSTPIVGNPNVGATDTFISIGVFDSKKESENLLKYIKTKFARVMLGVKKATQHNPKSAWSEVPIQNFNVNSDINWDESISNIDNQLYLKYNLSSNEIDFIESKAQEMD